jgi:hypothetical protein
MRRRKDGGEEEDETARRPTEVSYLADWPEAPRVPEFPRDGRRSDDDD